MVAHGEKQSVVSSSPGVVKIWTVLCQDSRGAGDSYRGGPCPTRPYAAGIGSNTLPVTPEGM